MNTNVDSLRNQLRRNAVALISLVVAVASLGYTSWRNEITEDNRSLRQAAFEILLKLGELQQVVFYAHYDRDPARGNPRTGWAYALTVRDLAQVLPEPVPAQAGRLLDTWGRQWERLGRDDTSATAVTREIDATRDAVLALVRRLE